LPYYVYILLSYLNMLYIRLCLLWTDS